MHLYRRKPFSILALKTHKLLVGLLGLFGALLLGSYLFLMNHLAMEGYKLSKISETHKSLAHELEQIESKVAKASSRHYISQTHQQKTMVFQGGLKTYVVIPNQYTAKADDQGSPETAIK